MQKTSIITSFIITFLLIISCGKSNKNIPQKKEKTTTATEKTEEFDFSTFEIGEKHLGPIQIGMSIEEAENYTGKMKKQKALASDFGYGGGSPAYIYHWNETPVFALLPELDSNKILVIIAIHNKLKTTNKATPQLSVKQLLKIYPGRKIYKDSMNDWEFLEDPEHRWTFVFLTDKEQKIGSYTENTTSSEPKNMNIKSDWITIE